MALGIAAVPGILLRLDDMGAAPGWVWIGLVGWLGIFVVYPAWAIWLGRVETRLAGGRSRRPPVRGPSCRDRRRRTGLEVRAWTGC